MINAHRRALPGISAKVVGVAILWCVLSTNCQDKKQATPSEFESFIIEKNRDGLFNGNLLISRKGRLVYQSALGLSNPTTGDSLHMNSVFRLASVSKQFTAMAIMILMEKGLLTYDQDLRDFIPELPYNGITIRHLLHHTSGMPDYVALMDNYWMPEYAVDDPRRLLSGNQDIINMLVEKRPDMLFEPGEKYLYSNTGYVMLATVISRVSKAPFEEFLKDQIFIPSGMPNTLVYHYGKETDPGLPNRVIGFEYSDDAPGWVINDSHYLNRAQGDGGIYATVADLSNWDRSLYSNRLVSEETLNEAFASGILNDGSSTHYGFGVNLAASPNGGRVIQHGGGWVGFRTHLYRDIEEEICIVLLTNNTNDQLSAILKSLKEMIY